MKEYSREGEATGKILMSVNESLINFILDKYEDIISWFKEGKTGV